MKEVAHLLNWKMRLTWRMYTRHTIASLESLLFILVFILWLVFSTWLLAKVAVLAQEGNWISRAMIFCDLYTFIFLIWLLIPLAGYRMNEAYDLKRLKIYPLPSWKVFLANLLGAFTDISVLMPFAGCLAVFFAFDPDPAHVPLGILMILGLVFLLVVSGLTLVNVLYILLPRLNLVSVGMVILAGVLVWAMLLNLGIAGHPAQSFNYFIFLKPAGVEFFRPYPAGQIGIALDALMDGRREEMRATLGGFSLWTAGILAFNYILVAYLWESDQASKSSRRIAGGTDVWSLVLNGIEKLLAPLFGVEAVAVYKKDMLEFATRSPYFFMYKILPGTIAPVIILLAMHWNLEHAIQLVYHPNASVIAKAGTFAVVIFIVVTQGLLFAGNQFGFESDTIRTLFILPTARRHFLLGKNLFLGGLFLLDSIVLSLLFLLYYPSAFTFFAWFSLLVTLFLLILSIGNFTSSIWPYWMPLDQPSFTLRTTMIIGLVNLGATIALAISFAPALALVVVPYYYYGNAALSWTMMPVAIVYGILFHRLTLGPAVGLFRDNEFLLLRRVADHEQL